MGLYGQTFNQQPKNNLYGQTFNPDFQNNTIQPSAEPIAPAFPTGFNSPLLPGENPNTPAWFHNAAMTLTTLPRAFFNAPINQRIGQAGAEVATGQKFDSTPSTGNKVADIGASLLGGLMGFGVNPGGSLNAGSTAFKLGENALSKVPQLSRLPKLAQAGAKLAGGSVAYDLGNSVSNGDTPNPKDMAIAAAENAALGLLPMGIGKGAEALKEARLPKPVYKPLESNPFKDIQTAYKSPSLHDVKQGEYNQLFSGPDTQFKPAAMQADNPAQYFGKTQSDLEAAFPPRQFNQYKFSTGEQRAMDELTQGMQTAQNYVGHNDILAAYPPGTSIEAAYADVKANTGVDIPKLTENLVAAQNAKTSLSPDRLKMGKVAGVIPDIKPRDMLKPQVELPKAQPKLLPPGPRQWTNKEGISQAPVPFQSLKNGELVNPPKQPQLQSKLGPNFESSKSQLGQGFGQVVKDPRLPMKLQSFNDTTPALPDTMSQLVSKTSREPFSLDTAKTLANKYYIKTTDNLFRLNQLDKYVEQATGQRLSPEDRSYMLGLNSRGSGAITSHILEENLVDLKGNVVGKPLKSITKQLKNEKVANQFDDYLNLRQSISRMRKGEKVFSDDLQMTPEKAELKINEYNKTHPEFQKLAQETYDFQNKLAKSLLVDTGIVSPEAFGKWVIDNPNYVPNQRLFSEMEKPLFSSAKRGFAGQSNPVKARTGSQRKIISPLESIMEHVDQYVKVAKRNEVMQAVIRNIQKDPEALKGWAEIIPTKPELKNSMVEDINKVLQTEGIDGVVEQFNKQFDEVFNAKKQNLDSGNIVTGLINGEKVHVKVNDPLLLDALTNLKPQAQNIVISALGQLTRVMKNLTTGINPVFSLTRNIFRDIPTAYTMSKSTNNPLVFGKDLIGSVVSVLKNDELYKSYKSVGGGYASSSVSTSRNALAESKARLLPGYALKNPGKTLLGGLERLNNAVETAPRLGEFKRISQPGDYGSKVKALYEANDVTTNFNKFGNVIKEADSVIPYLNAAWQGIDKLGRAFKDNPQQTIPKAFAAITIPSILLYQINHNNPAYQQLSDYIKDNNFLIPKPDGTFIKVPKPRELGVMFGSSVERFMRQWQDGDSEGFNRFMDTIKANFKPPARSILAPFTDIRSNKDYVNRPIVSGGLQRLSPPLQFDQNTSEPAKFLGKKLNQSPQQLDYLARSYLGGVAQLGIPATTKNASVADTLKRQVTADPVFSNDIIGDFYTTKDKIDTGYSDAKATGDKTLEVGSQYRSYFTKAADQMGTIRKQVDLVQVQPNLSPDEKQARIRDLQIKILEIARKANSTFKTK